MGGYIFTDRNGAVERTGFKGTYAYHLNFRHSQLSFGLSLVAYQFRLNDELIHLADPGQVHQWPGEPPQPLGKDPVQAPNIQRTHVP